MAAPMNASAINKRIHLMKLLPRDPTLVNAKISAGVPFKLNRFPLRWPFSRASLFLNILIEDLNDATRCREFPAGPLADKEPKLTPSAHALRRTPDQKEGQNESQQRRH
ncbi:hypothetical protein [Methylocystis sp. JR02]|uniref:hypothetical protein n=1 Tax=Methylocystis sp. JR02 TaxID=3046284 RepID=UPI0024B8E269|nr:hypothetical protein [Methylocystis sp. JR02]MDJ0447333.1 hypothetical protein [Methylocystis sp. JR02]